MKPLPSFSDLLIEAGKRLKAREPYLRVMSALGYCTTQARWQTAPPIARVLYFLIEREATARESSSPWAFEHRADLDGTLALRHARLRRFV